MHAPSNSLFAKIFLAVFGIALFVVINSSNEVKKSSLESTFEFWLSQTALKINAPLSEVPRPSIRITLSSSYPELEVNWFYGCSGNEDEERKTLRLLELIRESNIFSSPSVPSTDPALMLTIEEGTHRFSHRFTRKIIDDRPAAQSFLKLFQLYSATVKSPETSLSSQ